MIARLSLATAFPGRRDEVVRLYQEMDEFLRTHQGYIASCVFTDPEDPNEVGRLSFYQSLADVTRANAESRVVALRSQVHMLIQPGHTEKVLDVTSSINLP